MKDVSQLDARAFIANLAAVKRYARALRRKPQDADDLVQECATRVLALRDRSRDVKNVRSYLLSMLHNIHVDDIARSHRVGEHIALDAIEFENDLSCAAEQEHPLLLRDLARRFDKLPEDQRDVVVLVALQGRTYRQTAEILRVPIGTVMSRLSRARDTMREAIELDESESPASDQMADIGGERSEVAES